MTDKPTPIDLPINVAYPPPAGELPEDVTAAYDRYAAVARRVLALNDELDQLPAALDAARASDADALAAALGSGGKAKPTAALAGVQAREVALRNEYEALRLVARDAHEQCETSIARHVDGDARTRLVDAAASTGRKLDDVLAGLRSALAEFNAAHRHRESAVAMVKAGRDGRWPADWQVRDAINADALDATVRAAVDAAISDALTGAGISLDRIGAHQ